MAQDHADASNATQHTNIIEGSISISEPENALPRTSLAELPQVLRDACAKANWSALMPVQELSLPYLLARRDLMVQSRTGSGKTGTYLLPLLRHLSPERKVVQALVLAPTRELALQVEREAKILFADTGLSAVAVYGGVGYAKQHEGLRAGAQLVVGTPGRILDHLIRRSMNLDALRVLVFDEADRMLSIGFYPDMKEVQRYLPKGKIATCLFSATYPPHVLKLAEEFMSVPAMLSLSQTHVHVAEVQHMYCMSKGMDKDRTLIRILEIENPASAIIFCNTKANAHYVSEVLKGFGYNADSLSADLSQSRREGVLKKIREGNLRFLVATDVAARGIDIPDLSHVILFDVPEDHENYIHRAGRTGRAGAAGTVISLVDVMQKMELERIAKKFSIPLIQHATPSDDDVSKVVGQRITTILEARYRKLTGLERERMRRFSQVTQLIVQQEQSDDTKKHDMNDEVHYDLFNMLLDACYQESLNISQSPIGQVESGERQGQAKRKRRNRRPKKNTGGGTGHERT